MIKITAFKWQKFAKERFIRFFQIQENLVILFTFKYNFAMYSKQAIPVDQYTSYEYSNTNDTKVPVIAQLKT